MHSRNRWIMVALGALVAVAAVIVYAERASRMNARKPAPGDTAVTTQNETTAPKTPGVTEVPKPTPPTTAPEPESTPAAVPLEPLPAPAAVPLEPLPPAESPLTTPGTSAAAGDAHGVLHDLRALPPPAKRMLNAIVAAARSGHIENMRPVLEMNELKPMVAPSAVADPIAYWKKHSADGEGRDVLAALLTVLSSGFVRVKEGEEEMYIWPYFAEKDLAALTPEQTAEFNRLVPPSEAGLMQRSGKYGYYRVGIAADGVWHYFLQ